MDSTCYLFPELRRAKAGRGARAEAACDDMVVSAYGDADGAGSDSDVWYRIVSEVEHYVEPQNGAAFARISKPFSAVTRSDLQGAKYGSGRLATEGVDDPDVLNVGDVIALRTNTGQYAKIEIAGFEAYTLSDGMTYPRYNVRLRYVLYPR